MYPSPSRLDRLTFAAAVIAGIVFIAGMCGTVANAFSAEPFDPACLSKLNAQESFDVACLVKLQAVPAVRQVAESQRPKPSAELWCITNCPPCRTQEGICDKIKEVDIKHHIYDANTAPPHIRQAVANRMGFPIIAVPGKPLRSGVMSAKDFIAFASTK